MFFFGGGGEGGVGDFDLATNFYRFAALALE